MSQTEPTDYEQDLLGIIDRQAKEMAELSSENADLRTKLVSVGPPRVVNQVADRLNRDAALVEPPPVQGRLRRALDALLDVPTKPRVPR